MKRAFFVAAFFLLCAARVDAQVDSCLDLFENVADKPLLVYHNPDSVMIDTCSSSSTYGHEYGKKWFQITFAYDVLPIPIAPHDTIIEVSWTAIDSAYPSLRDSFASLEKIFSKITFRKAYPEMPDTSSEANNIFFFRFDKLVDIDTALAIIGRFPFMTPRPIFTSWPFTIAAVQPQEVKKQALILNSGTDVFSFQIPELENGENKSYYVADLLGRRMNAGSLLNAEIGIYRADIPRLFPGVYFFQAFHQVFRFSILR